jgi:hypothetical protein
MAYGGSQSRLCYQPDRRHQIQLLGVAFGRLLFFERRRPILTDFVAKVED